MSSSWAARASSAGRRNLDRVARQVRRRAGAAYDDRLLAPADASAEIARRLRDTGPLLVGRVGSTEQAVLRRHARTGWLPGPLAPFRYGPGLEADICALSGFFPARPAALAAFSELYLSCLRRIDVLAVWHNRYEGELIGQSVPASCVLVPLRALSPTSDDPPWTLALEGQHVLVVHPFAETIRAQLPRLADVFPQGLWPDCRIDVMPAVQSLGGQPDGPYRSWFDALETMSEGIEAFTGDTVLIGAGAYGLPLAARAAACGRKAVVVGGGLQILFGVRGSRWDTRPDFAALVNDAWVRPTPDERPPGAQQVENGCYW